MERCDRNFQSTVQNKRLVQSPVVDDFARDQTNHNNQEPLEGQDKTRLGSSQFLCIHDEVVQRSNTSGSFGSSVGFGTRIVVRDLDNSLSLWRVTCTVPGTCSARGSNIPRAITSSNSRSVVTRNNSRRAPNWNVKIAGRRRPRGRTRVTQGPMSSLGVMFA